jgi:hypothetical protein
VFRVPANRNSLLRVLTMIVAGIFLLQSATASVGATGHADGQALGGVCAPSQPFLGDGGNPAAPVVPAAHPGLCCILHAGAAYFPPKSSATHRVWLQFPDDKPALRESESRSARRFEPSGAPQSPRAPPISSDSNFRAITR